MTRRGVVCYVRRKAEERALESLVREEGFEGSHQWNDKRNRDNGVHELSDDLVSSSRPRLPLTITFY